MKMPLISVVLPIYNIESYLDRCMEAVLNQTYSNLEILMVDDGSPDGCPQICDRYAEQDSRVRALHKENGGLSDARNYGIARARGEYITCIDPDDYVDPDYVEYLYRLIDKYETRMSICQHVTEYDNGSVKDHGSSGDELMDIETCLRRMLYHDVIDTSAWAKLYHKSLFDTVSYPKGKIFEDIGTTYALIKLDLLEMTDKMGHEVIRVYPSLKQAVLRRRVYARFSTLNQMLGTDDYEKEREQIIRFILHHKKRILKDPRAPRRDKIAIRLLSVSYGLYKAFWRTYQGAIFKKN